ncbi:MAG: hypothetical protein SF029_22410 [bacterium]|nr:hypothetical protein [bacterium]
MSVQVFWDNEDKTVIRAVYEGDVTLEDYYTAIDQTAALMQQVTHSVYHILHRQNVRSQPSTMATVMRYANRKLPANHAGSVIIGSRALTKILVNIAKSIAPHLAKEVYFADTLEDARRIIAQQHQPSRIV